MDLSEGYQRRAPASGDLEGVAAVVAADADQSGHSTLGDLAADAWASGGQHNMKVSVDGAVQ